MISSMTGFARISKEIDGISYTVEIKTVNNRYFKPGIKLPETIAFLAGDIEKYLRENIYRGSVGYVLKFKNTSGEPMFDIDTVALKSYIKKLGAVIAETEIDNSQHRLNLADLLILPGVVRPQEPENEAAEKIRTSILEITAEAVEQLKKMRAEEGSALADDMLQNCRQIVSKLEAIEQRRDIVIKEYHEKLKSRIEQLTAAARLSLDEDTLARETALYADRSDIAEEITRLNSHIEQFSENCKTQENVGRKLDFITQEMLREANTIASKASDATICLDVVDIKSYIERIKEQVQNVE